MEGEWYFRVLRTLPLIRSPLLHFAHGFGMMIIIPGEFIHTCNNVIRLVHLWTQGDTVLPTTRWITNWLVKSAIYSISMMLRPSYGVKVVNITSASVDAKAQWRRRSLCTFAVKATVNKISKQRRDLWKVRSCCRFWSNLSCENV